MLDRRKAGRVALYEVGSVALNEHTWVPVIICDRSDLGARLAMLDADVVPETFLLKLPDTETVQVCKAVWRTHEVIGAWFDGDPKEQHLLFDIDLPRHPARRRFAA